MDTSITKFIKKIPPSGGGPAFKLTLPHQIVHSHLMHLVDEGFELVPSAQVHTSWQASIAPRRNKERSEYTLQGWKLFAEAHRIQAGDQVSFELVSPRRMVVQVIQAADPNAAAARARERASASAPAPAPKAPKHREESSPTRAQQFYQADDGELWMDSSSLNGGELLSDEWNPPLPRVSEDSSYMDMTPRHTTPQAAPLYPSQASQRTERWVPADARQPPLLAVARPPARYGIPSSASYDNLGGRLRGSPDSHSSRTLRCSSLLALASSGTAAPASGFYSELLHASPGSGNVKGEEISQSPVPDNLFDGLLSAEDDLVPTTPSPDVRQDPAPLGDRRQARDHGPPPIDHQLGNLTATIQRLQDDAAHFRAQARRSEDETAHLQSLFASQQAQLDRQAREALRAAMGLEKCAGALTSNMAAEVREQASGVVTDLNGCLGVLKGTLWQLLVLASNEDEDCTLHHQHPPAE